MQQNLQIVSSAIFKRKSDLWETKLHGDHQEKGKCLSIRRVKLHNDRTLCKLISQRDATDEEATFKKPYLADKEVLSEYIYIESFLHSAGDAC